MTTPVSVFCSYEHADEIYRSQLELQLKHPQRLGTIDTWYDRLIQPGEAWQEQVDKRLKQADIILLLISPAFMASDYCYDVEMRRAMERHEKDGAEVIPIIIRTVDWQNTPFGGLKPLPADGRPVDTWPNRDEAWADVARGVVERAKTMMAARRQRVPRAPRPPRSSIVGQGPPEATLDVEMAVKDLIRDRPKNVMEHLRKGVKLLDATVRKRRPNLEAIQDIAVFFLQEMLGSGSKVEWDQDHEIIEHVLRRLREICPEPPCAGAAAHERISCVVRCLEALQCTTTRAPLPLPQGDEALALLPVWVRVYQRWSALAQTSEDPDVDDKDLWEWACKSQPALITTYLSRHYTNQGDAEQGSLPSVRILHSLWFCLLLLKEDGTTNPMDPAIQDVRASLAHVLRESLRFLCFGERPGYYFDTRTYTQSLRRLIVHHAGLDFGLRFRYGIEGLMEMIGKESGVNRYAPTEHLQHILETYMAGHFILSMQLAGGTARLHETLAERLSSDGPTSGVPSSTRCRQVFILAALFHDVGLLFLPTVNPELGGALGLRFDNPISPLNELGAGIHAALLRMAERCVKEMEPYVERSGDGDHELRRWLGAQVNGPDHGLLGAWYLHQFCRDLYADGGERCAGFDAVLRDAIRAILLHNALDVPIDAARDPIASVLVLCDEVFEWDPAQPVRPSSIGRSLPVIATEAPAHEPRDRSIRMQHLRIDNDASGALRATLDIDQTVSWPQIHIEMQGPQRLQTPVFQIWLRKSRNLGRIRRAPCGWGPTLVMRSSFPCEGQLNRTLMEMLLRYGKLLPEQKVTLRQWFDEIHVEARGMVETAHLGPFIEASLCTRLQELQPAYVAGMDWVIHGPGRSPGQPDTQTD